MFDTVVRRDRDGSHEPTLAFSRHPGASMSSASASPMLPLELEREIFEIYALSWPKLVPKLMLVAKCVQEWYGTIFGRRLLSDA